MKFTCLIVSIISCCYVYGQKENLYHYSIDLDNINDDRIEVILSTPSINKSEIEFIFPVSVPGYYNINLKFGNLVSNFEAFTAEGRTLPVEKKGENKWLIKNASALKTIKYKVDDIWEVKDKLSHWIPAENIFEKDKVFLLNQGAAMGYFENMGTLPIQVQIKYPQHLYPATGADTKEKQKGLLTYTAKHYRDLIDKPILFTPVKPLSFKVAGSEVLISVYAEMESITNETIYKTLQPVLKNIAQYLGNQLPVKKYAFLGYFYKGPIFASAMLEHNNSSVFVYPEQWDEKLLGSTFLENLTETSYHEYFHILTPLNIHSEELLHFNFASPSMSKHLWLYEGMTEYLSQHVQVNQHTISADSFYRNIEHLIMEMKEYKSDVSLTEISLKTYGELNDEYDNVELKGVLVNLLLDIQLRELSGGKYGAKDLVKNLVKKFGKDKAFRDDELFNIITSMTYPVLKEFFAKYIEGIEPLPLKEYFAKVGLIYNEKENHITTNPNATNSQKKLRDDWLFK